MREPIKTGMSLLSYLMLRMEILMGIQMPVIFQELILRVD